MNPEDDEQPGIATDLQELAEKIGTWIGIALLVWTFLICVVYCTIVILRHLP